MKDYYRLLGVAPNATSLDIKQAFRKLARQHHPDMNQGSKQAEENFKQINEAYEVLGDPKKRRDYDRKFHSRNYWAASYYSPEPPASSANSNANNLYDLLRQQQAIQTQLEELQRASRRAEESRRQQDTRNKSEVDARFEELQRASRRAEEMRHHAATQRPKPQINEQPKVNNGTLWDDFEVDFSSWQVYPAATPPPRPKPRSQAEPFLPNFEFSVTINVTLEEVAKGGQRSIDLTAFYRRPHSEVIEIPAGVEHGTQLKRTFHVPRVANVVCKMLISVDMHPLYHRKGSDLYMVQKVSPTLLKRGGNLTIPTIYGLPLHCKIAPGTHSKTQYRFRGYGLPVAMNNPEFRGDLFVDIIADK